jgi:uroporphyrinogen decarboxylase
MTDDKKAIRENSRQRILTSFSHRQPDRCVTYIWINEDTMDNLRRFMGINSSREVVEELGIDKWKGVGLNQVRPDDYQERIDSLIPPEYKDAEKYQVTSRGRVLKVHQGADYLEDVVWHPLEEAKTLKDLDRYPFPRPDWIEVPDDLEERIAQSKEEGSVVSGGITQAFKAAWVLRGMNNVLMDYLINPDLINEMYERIYSFATASCVSLAKAGVDMIKITGDLGMQNGLIMSPEVWREFDKERLRQLISRAKEENPDLKMYMHTDGDVRTIIEDLIEIGLDILNPIQPECMDPVEIKKKYGDRLVLHGAVSLQKTLPFGSPEDVQEEVRYLIKNCNVNGGFVIGPSNVLFKEIPPENIVAMYEAVY